MFRVQSLNSGTGIVMAEYRIHPGIERKEELIKIYNLYTPLNKTI